MRFVCGVDGVGSQGLGSAIDEVFMLVRIWHAKAWWCDCLVKLDLGS